MLEQFSPLSLRARARTDSSVLLFLHVKVAGRLWTFQINGICIDRGWTYLKIKSILKSQVKHSQKHPQGLHTHSGHVLG